MTETVKKPPEMTTIQKLISGVPPACALLAGCQLDLFTPLSEGPLTAEEVALALGVGVAKLRPLLYALVSANILSANDGRFANTPEANYYLVKGSPGYLGKSHELWSMIWSADLKTAKSIRTGIGQAHHEFDYASTPPGELEKVFRGLHDGTMAAGRLLASTYDFSSYLTVLDVGGGSGGMAIALTEALPHLKATVVDLPSVTPITQRFVDEAGAAERVLVMPVDVVHEPLPGTYDLAVLRSVIQTLSPDQAGRTIDNVGRVVRAGGAIFVIGAVLDDSRLSPPQLVANSIFFLNAYEGGQAYTEQEYRTWLAGAGFEGMERTVFPEGHSLLSARKVT